MTGTVETAACDYSTCPTWADPTENTKLKQDAQDRIAEKRFVASCGIPVAPHAVIERAEDLDALDAALLPGILKSLRRREG